jgi:L-lactate dehydrogenase (cytochrome)
MGWIGANFDPGISWQDLQWIRDEWKGKLVIKGILDEDDARDALAFGADGIVVSNHGGRQLDGALSTARALPSIAAAVQGRMTVFVDGGVRTGTDVFRMLALGADGVLIGRAFVYALAAQGQAGVERLLAIMEKDIRTNMVLTGVTTLKDVGPDVLAVSDDRSARWARDSA